MKLKKINEEHYVVENNDGIITQSTQPIEIIHTSGVTMTNPPMGYIKIIELPLSEVKELLGEVDVEKKAKENYVEPLNKQGEKRAQLIGNGGLFGFNKFKKAFKKGYTQAIEDNKEKKYTEAQLIWAIQEAYGHGQNDEFDGVNKAEKSIIVITNYLQPKTEWEVEFINGKLTLI